MAPSFAPLFDERISLRSICCSLDASFSRCRSQIMLPAKRILVAVRRPRHFRRFLTYLDQLRPAAGLEKTRKEIRRVLMQLSGTHGEVLETCKSRRGLDGLVDMSALMRLLESCDLSPCLSEILAGAFLASNPKSCSYRSFFAMARLSQTLLRQHVDDLLKACFASVDLETLLEELAPQGLTWELLFSQLEAHGIQLDVEELACALNCYGRVPVPELTAMARAFRTRHAAVLQHLARQPNESFMQMIHVQRAART